MSRSFRRCLLASLPLWFLASSFLAAQSPPTSRSGKKAKLTEEEQFILDLFQASSKSFRDDRLVLEYDFETKDESLVADWKPSLEKTRQRIRWSRGVEGTPSTVEDGIVIGDSGQWVHKGVWLPDVTVTVELVSVAPYRDGTVLAPIFYEPKKKLSLGANGGYQIVCLKGTRHAKRPHPRTTRPIVANNRFVMGYRFENGVFHALSGKRATVDTVEVPKLTKDFERGHAGLAWTGSVQSFLFKVTIEGRIDPEWVASERDPKPKRRR